MGSVGSGRTGVGVGVGRGVGVGAGVGVGVGLGVGRGVDVRRAGAGVGSEPAARGRRVETERVPVPLAEPAVSPPAAGPFVGVAGVGGGVTDVVPPEGAGVGWATGPGTPLAVGTVVPLAPGDPPDGATDGPARMPKPGSTGGTAPGRPDDCPAYGKPAR